MQPTSTHSTVFYYGEPVQWHVRLAGNRVDVSVEIGKRVSLLSDVPGALSELADTLRAAEYEADLIRAEHGLPTSLAVAS